jgi:hypothetical protein
MNNTEIDGEVWKPIPDTEGRYEVSNIGRVRSLVAGYKHGSVPRRTPPFNNKPDRSGYWVINLRVNGRVKCRCVSELVLTAFVGPRPSPIHDAAHVNGDKSINWLSNLQWATKKENAAHKRLHRTHRSGSARRRRRREVSVREVDEWLPPSGFYPLGNAQRPTAAEDVAGTGGRLP